MIYYKWLCLSQQGDPLPSSLVDLVRNSPISSVEDLKLLLQEETDAIGTNDHNSHMHTCTYTESNKTDVEEVSIWVYSQSSLMTRGKMGGESSSDLVCLTNWKGERERSLQHKVTTLFSCSGFLSWFWVMDVCITDTDLPPLCLHPQTESKLSCPQMRTSGWLKN